MKDIKGNEFKVGCVFKNEDGERREVLKLLTNELVYWNITTPIEGSYRYSDLIPDGATILHYRELAPDKNGKMLCQYDIVNEGKVIVDSFKDGNGKLYLVLWMDGCWTWAELMSVTFVSRPTDAPTEAARKKAELLAKADELIAKAKELKIKAEEM